MTRETERLSDAEIDDALAELPGWRREGAHLVRSWTFADFDEAMAFVNAVAEVARGLDHHPDLANVYDRVTLSVTTHDAGGLTLLDVAFARRVNALPMA